MYIWEKPKHEEIFHIKGIENWGNSLLSLNTPARDDQFLIFPNPVKDFLQIRYKEADITINFLAVSDAEGKIVWSSNEVGILNKSDVTIDCNNFRKGVYFIYFSTNKGTFSHHFIKL